MLTIPVSSVPQNGSFEENDWVLTLDDLGLKSPFLKEKGVVLDLEISRVEEKLMARGKVRAALSLSCSRCLNDFEKSVESDFFVEFEPPDDHQMGEAADEDPNVAYLVEENIPLGEELRQELEMSRPAKAICKPDCKGLCVNCGCDRNQKHCDCDTEGGNRPLQGLKKLLNQED